MSETNQAAADLVVIGKEVTVTGVYLTRAGEETFTEKFIVPLEHAEKALVNILTREEDSLKARLLAADMAFRGIRTHLVTSIVDALGPKPAPVVAPAPVDPLADLNAQLAAANDANAKLSAQIVALEAQLSAAEANVASLTEEKAALSSQVATLSQSAAAPVEAPAAAPAPAAEPDPSAPH